MSGFEGSFDLFGLLGFSQVLFQCAEPFPNERREFGVRDFLREFRIDVASSVLIFSFCEGRGAEPFFDLNVVD